MQFPKWLDCLWHRESADHSRDSLLTENSAPRVDSKTMLLIKNHAFDVAGALQGAATSAVLTQIWVALSKGEDGNPMWKTFMGLKVAGMLKAAVKRDGAGFVVDAAAFTGALIADQSLRSDPRVFFFAAFITLAGKGLNALLKKDASALDRVGGAVTFAEAAFNGVAGVGDGLSDVFTSLEAQGAARTLLLTAAGVTAGAAVYDAVKFTVDTVQALNKEFAAGIREADRVAGSVPVGTV